jgi:hypothetical protein
MNHIFYMPFSDKIGSFGFIWLSPAKDKITAYVDTLRENEQGECLVYNSDGTPVLMRHILNGHPNSPWKYIQWHLYRCNRGQEKKM